MERTKITGPVVIGGVGGSGTRLIAQFLKKAGFYIGTDLNKANDNLWFTLLFKRREILSCSDEEFDALVEIFISAMTGGRPFTRQQVEIIQALASEDREKFSVHWLRQRAKTLLCDKPDIYRVGKWGWKEPNTHIVLNRLIARIENIKYIHVARNGLDMAHSRNQNQLRWWGANFIIEEFDITPYYSLKYWCNVHKRVIRIGESMGKDFLLLNYDNLCVNPKTEITRLLDFLGEKPNSLTPPSFWHWSSDQIQ